MSTPQKSIHLRDAAEADYAAIRALTLEAYGAYAFTLSEAAWGDSHQAFTSVMNTLDQQEAEKIVAERNSKIVGSVLLYPPAERDPYGQGKKSRYPEVRLLAVALQMRGLGVGRALIDECVRRAKVTNARKLGLHTADFMEIATALYIRLGFVRAPMLDFEAAGPHTVKGYRLELG